MNFKCLGTMPILRLSTVQPAAGMNLPRIACVNLLLNPTMTAPLTQFHSRTNPMTDSWRTSNLPSMQLSREMILLALPCPCLA
jgi:hypothetical protein